MNISKARPALIAGVLIALLFGVALYLRVALPYDKVFTDVGIKFTSNDAYYHMRMVDNLVYNFPHHMSFDPYILYPSSATEKLSINFFDYLLAGIIWVIGWGAPTPHLIDVIGVYYPAVMGALTVIPVYFIGKELFGRWAGVFAAGLITLLPGEFLGRSILGYTDNHVAETLFTTMTMLFLVMAIKAARQNQFTFKQFSHPDWAMNLRPIIYSLLAGIFLGIYILSWLGALLFVFFIFIYFVVQFIIDHIRRQNTAYLSLVGFILFLTALAMVVPSSPGQLFTASMLIAVLSMPVLAGISWLMAGKKIRPVYFPLIIVGLGLIGGAFLYLVNPALISSMVKAFSIFAPTTTQRTTIEMQPFFTSQISGGNFLYTPAWVGFNVSLPLSLIALVILIYLVVKHGDAGKSLLVVWSLVILAATIAQRRFGYYLVVNVALLTGFLLWQTLKLVGFKEEADEAAETARKTARKLAPKKGGRSSFNLNPSQLNMILTVIIIFLVVYSPSFLLTDYPNALQIVPVTYAAKQARYAASDAWFSSLTWMQANTPEPFGSPDVYYQLTKLPPRGESYQYPASAYAVMSWWDYGYWITRIAHRIPNANPSQDPNLVAKVATFFTAQDEETANKIARESNSAYVVIDYEMAYIDPRTVTGKFPAIITWAGQDVTNFLDIFLVPQQEVGGKMTARLLFFPEYYRSLSTRLYCFDGKAVTPESTAVIAYEERGDGKGNVFKIVTDSQEFDSYEKAEAYISSQSSKNYKIISQDPFVSPVPLAALSHYKLIHSSDSSMTRVTGEAVPEVKIFEYTN